MEHGLQWHGLQWRDEPLKNPLPAGKGLLKRRQKSAEADLGKDALTGEEFGAEADHETEHGQATIPGLSEVDEAEACVVGHGREPIG